MESLDYAQELAQNAKEFKAIAYEYKNQRANYAEALNKLTALIYKAGLHDDKSAFETGILYSKAILFISAFTKSSPWG